MGDVVDKEFVARNAEAVLRIEVCEMRELVGELVAQAWLREDLPVTVAFAALHERRDECMLVVHNWSVAQDPRMVGNAEPFARIYLSAISGRDSRSKPVKKMLQCLCAGIAFGFGRAIGATHEAHFLPPFAAATNR